MLQILMMCTELLKELLRFRPKLHQDILCHHKVGKVDRHHLVAVTKGKRHEANNQVTCSAVNVVNQLTRQTKWQTTNARCQTTRLPQLNKKIINNIIHSMTTIVTTMRHTMMTIREMTKRTTIQSLLLIKVMGMA